MSTAIAEPIGAPATELSSLEALGAGTAPNVADSDTGTTGDGPSSLIGIGPPSPLTGCYLLIVVGEPHSDGHKDIILQRLLKGMCDTLFSFIVENITFQYSALR